MAAVDENVTEYLVGATFYLRMLIYYGVLRPKARLGAVIDGSDQTQTNKLIFASLAYHLVKGALIEPTVVKENDTIKDMQIRVEAAGPLFAGNVPPDNFEAMLDSETIIGMIEASALDEILVKKIEWVKSIHQMVQSGIKRIIMNVTQFWDNEFIFPKISPV